MTTRVLLDTNVLIDYFGRREPFFEACAALRAAAFFGSIELWASARSFTDVFYVLSKLVPAAALQRAFLESLGFLNIVSVDEDALQRACERAWPDFEDCLVALAAEDVGASWLVTRDECGFAQAGVPIISPAALVSRIEDETQCCYTEIALGCLEHSA